MKHYFQQLAEHLGNGWNRFWFTPADPTTAAVLRISTGGLGLFYILSYSFDLLTWFGPQGMLPASLVRRFAGTENVFRFSYFFLGNDPLTLWLLHVVGILILLSFTLGLASRITNILSLIVVLSYVHRAPMLTGLMEPVLSMLLLYLCVAPSGARLSVDAWIRRRRRPGSDEPSPSVLANISVRLIQLHLAGLCLIMGLNQLAGEPWWNGTGIWFLMAMPETRVVDLTGMHADPWYYLVNLWTHLLVAFELAFAILIWNRWARPLLLLLAVPIWLSLVPISGLLGFCLAMLVANLAFVPPQSWRLGRRPQPAREPAVAQRQRVRA